MTGIWLWITCLRTVLYSCIVHVLACVFLGYLFTSCHPTFHFKNHEGAELGLTCLTLEKIWLPSTCLHLPPSCFFFFFYLMLHLIVIPLPNPSVLTSLCPPLCAGVATGRERGECLKSHREYLIRSSKASFTQLGRACW